MGNRNPPKSNSRKIRQRFESSPYRYRNALDMVVLGQYYLDQGEDAKTVLNSLYKKIQQDQPRIAEGFTAAGELALEKQDFGLAATHYGNAKLDPDDPAIQFALAQAYASSDSEKILTRP